MSPFAICILCLLSAAVGFLCGVVACSPNHEDCDE